MLPWTAADSLRAQAAAHVWTAKLDPRSAGTRPIIVQYAVSADRESAPLELPALVCARRTAAGNGRRVRDTGIAICQTSWPPDLACCARAQRPPYRWHGWPRAVPAPAGAPAPPLRQSSTTHGDWFAAARGARRLDPSAHGSVGFASIASAFSWRAAWDQTPRVGLLHTHSPSCGRPQGRRTMAWHCH